MLPTSPVSVRRILPGILPWILRRGTYRIGVDLGSRFIKVVIVRRRGRDWYLKDWYVAEVPRPEFSQDPGSNNVTNFDEAIHQRIKTSLAKYIRLKPTIGISVPGSRVLVKTLTLPVMSEEEVREHLQWELDRYISTEMGEVLWDVHCCLQSSFEDSLHQQVILAVAKKDFIEKKILSFHELGVAVKFVDVDAFALVNLVTCNLDPEDVWLLAHLGPSGILLVIINQEEPVYLHEGPFEVEWYGDLVDQLRSKAEYSLESGMGKGSEQVLLEPFLEEVKSHIQEALRKYGGNPAHRPLSGILLSGGYSVIEEMPSRLTLTLGLPVTRIDPFKNIMVPAAHASNSKFSKNAPLLGVAMGMALREP